MLCLQKNVKRLLQSVVFLYLLVTKDNRGACVILPWSFAEAKDSKEEKVILSTCNYDMVVFDMFLWISTSKLV